MTSSATAFLRRRESMAMYGAGGLDRDLSRLAEAEIEHHLDYGWHEGADGTGNKRNGVTRRTVATEAGSIEVAIPRGRAGPFEPTVPPKNARRIAGFDGQVLDLYAKGLTPGEIREHLADFYDIEFTTGLLSQVTDQIAEELAEWCNRLLDTVVIWLAADHLHRPDRQRVR